MKFEIKDLEKFVRILDLASYVVYDKKLNGIKEIEGMIQDLYKQIKEGENQNYVEYDEELTQYFTNEAIEHANNEVVTQESEENFWDTLILKLVERDISDEIEAEVFDENDSKVKLIKHDQFAKEYTDEFYENGLENLYIVDFQDREDDCEDDLEEEDEKN